MMACMFIVRWMFVMRCMSSMHGCGRLLHGGMVHACMMVMCVAVIVRRMVAMMFVVHRSVFI